MCFQLFFCSFIKQDLDEYNAITLYSSIESLFFWRGLIYEKKTFNVTMTEHVLLGGLCILSMLLQQI